MRTNRGLYAVLVCTAFSLTACATQEAFRSLETPQTATVRQPYQGARAVVAIGKFANRSSYMRGIFSDGVDRLGGQARTILSSHLHQSQRFTVLDRENLAELQQEAQLGRQVQQLRGARYVLSGDVTEFGRKEVGDHQLFGILGRGKSQTAYAKVTINVLDTQTSAIVYSVQGAGEYELSNREVIGFGSTASYDSTLNGKVLDLAIREAVQKLAAGLDAGVWRANN